MLVPHVLACENESALIPLMEIARLLSAAFPVFLRVNACEAADVPCGVGGKVRLAGVRVATGLVVTITITVVVAVNLPVAASRPVMVAI
jgi:hypothetical protein